MNATDLKNAGFRVSVQMSDAEVQRAVRDAAAAYIVPIKPSFDFEEMTVQEAEAVMQLAFILLCRRTTVATRSGGKVKLAPSQSADGSQVTQADLDNADRLLRKIQTKNGNVSEMVDDVACIYYRHAFVGL